MAQTNRAVDAAGKPLVLTSRVPDWAQGHPLPDYLVARFPYRDRSAWLAEIAANRFTLDGAPIDAHTRLRAGQRLSYASSQPEPDVNLTVPVLHRDDAILVVDKPALLPCHADGAFVRHTVVHQVTQTEGRVRLVHRLDRETSGALILARTRAAHRHIDEQFRQSQVEKEYLAIVAGTVDRSFVCDGAIGRCTASSISLRRAVVPATAPDARPAVTHFEVVETFSDRTLLRCRPQTGRTHQIRVHLEHCGFPLLGDVLYGQTDGDYLAFVERVKRGQPALRTEPGMPPRQMLHASRIKIRHPLTAKSHTFTAPIPADFAAWADGNAPDR